VSRRFAGVDSLHVGEAAHGPDVGEAVAESVGDAGALLVELDGADDVGAADSLDVAVGVDDVVAAAPDSVAPAPVGDAEAPVDADAVPPTDPPVTMPLSVSVVSTACCTAATCAAISAGVASAPSKGNAFSLARAACSFRRSEAGGCLDTVTTIWSAIAVVMHAGQSAFSAPAALIGAIVSLCPTTRTTWNDTATVVQPRQRANANALFVSVTGAPLRTVTSA
jgi:hypothetical protein